MTLILIQRKKTKRRTRRKISVKILKIKMATKVQRVQIWKKVNLVLKIKVLQKKTRKVRGKVRMIVMKKLKEILNNLIKIISKDSSRNLKHHIVLKMIKNLRKFFILLAKLNSKVQTKRKNQRLRKDLLKVHLKKIKIAKIKIVSKIYPKLKEEK